jgi:carbon monoxide dehydrogenase subunit G
MAPIVTSLVISAPIQDVWDGLAAVETHADWMTDAESIVFVGERRSGAGTRIRVRTKVGPLRVDDVMEFTAWDPPQTMTVRHVGRIGGGGEFRLTEQDGGTRFTWVEDLRFPWYFGGALGWFFARPILRRIFAANLARFAATVE